MTNHEIALELIKLAEHREMPSLFKNKTPNIKPESYALFLADVFADIVSKLPPQDSPAKQS